MCMEQKEYSKMLQWSSKAFLLTQNERVLEKYFFQNSQEQWVGWLDGKSKKVVWNFSRVTVAQRMVVKMSEEGSYLYL